MYAFRFLLVALLCGFTVGPGPAAAQSGSNYDPSWYDADAPYVQINVTRDGVYRVSASALQDALPDGSTLSDIARETIRLYENGTEIPIQVTGSPEGSLTPSDRITFVGHRNRGGDEHWAYDYSRDYDQRAQSSTYYSLYSDTTTYWMTWGGREGTRYRQRSSSSPPSPTDVLRDTVHAEQDNVYYFGRPDENGNSLYTFSEGYFWRRFSHSSTSPISFTHTLAVDRRADTETDLNLSIRLTGATSANDVSGASCHRVEVEARLRQSTGAPSFESLTSVEWKDLDRQTITTSVQQDRIPAGGLDLRLTSYNSDFSSGCADPGSTLNRVLLDWIEAAYTRSLEPTDNTQRFAAPTAGEQSFALSGYAETDTIHVYNPLDSTRYDLPSADGTATFADSPSAAGTPYWAVGTDGFRTPATIRPDASSNWSASSNEADYLILTTRALRPSAQNLAAHRRTEAGGGYSVEIATVQNVFDEFDYGRPTPIAIRRFVRATQEWSTAPQFLAIFGDAQYPIDDGSISSLYPDWSVPSFGYSPSDGWFAMQTDGSEDWSEVLAVGRIPVRSVAQGNLFVEKLKNYETAPQKRWQKRMLLLAGGTSATEQRVLQDYSNRWGEIAADTFATTRNYTGPVHTGMDTSRYYKNVNDALDTSFQDSLAVDLKRGAGWLNYFGHSAAQTWEIVTDPPSEFDNAGRLPIVSSIGCRTGSFAGVRVGDKSLPSLGEQLVVGSTRPDGTPRDGARNGAIAHFGESALGFRTPSARISDALVRRVFVDTVRVLGEAIRRGKAEVNAEFGRNDSYAKHLLQYGLLGDPATQMRLPAKPDFRVASNLISTTPSAPTPSDELNVSVQIQNQGLIPSDSVDVRLVWENPDGATVRRSRRLSRFALKQSLTFTFSLSEQALGPNTFRVHVDHNDDFSEISETNNTAEQTTTVFGSGLELISPADQGIVSSRTPSLLFTLSREEQETKRVTLEVDSLPSFDSPALRRTTVEMSNFRDTWTPDRSLQHAKTYYWRGRPAAADESDWKTSQFTVRTDRSEGNWLQQDRLFQNNENERISWAPESGWSYDRFTRRVRITSEPGGVLGSEGTITVGTDDYEYRTLGFGIVVVDGTSGTVKTSESFCTYDVSDDVLNERRCGGGVDGEAAADLLASFLQSVDTGDYVLVRTRHLARSGTATISNRVKQLFRTLGGATSPHSSAIDTLRYDDVWALQARKGFPEETVEKVTEADGSELRQRTTLSFRFPDGKILTSRIGPASQWESLEWDLSSSSNDNVQFEVLAADSSRLLQRRTTQDGSVSLEEIDPTVHPYLRLRATLTDSTNRTPPQLNVWSVSYDGVPELAVPPSTLQSIPDTVEQGRSVSAAVPVYNLGSTTSAPVRVRYDLTDASNVTDRVHEDTLEALSPNTRDTSSVTLSTTDRTGPNQLTITAVSDAPPERFRANNTALRNFTVQADDTPPTLEVLTNGQPLPSTSSSVQDLEAPSLPFVSTQPRFTITLRDDNPYLTLDDTSHASVYLKDGLPSSDPSVISDFERVAFASDALTFVSASADSSTSWRARFTPTLPATDSTYTLKVEADDEAGNEIEPYQTSFRVQQNQEIEDVYPYPNPMSTHTTFAFRVIGGRNESEALRDFTLRIYTLSGRLVREFDRSDVSPLSPDWYGVRWNGRDEDGDRVATGTYLYQADVTGEDDSFEGDIEKVTVIR